MPKLDKKIYKLSIYLLKDSIKKFEDALKINDVKPFYFNDDIQVAGKVFIAKPKSTEADWRAFLQEGIDEQLPKVDNASNKAIAMFEINDRIYAIPFGYGKSLLKEEVIDREFGLKTALNIINADLLQSVDKANISDMALLTKTQASRKGNPDQFGIDIIKDLLKSVTGEPTEVDGELFGRVVTGNEAINISPYVNIFSLPGILKRLDEEYLKDTYKNRFDWIDNIKMEREAVVINELRKNLIRDLKAKNDSVITLCPPYIVDWETFEELSYTPKGEAFSNFEINDFYNEKGNILSTLDWDKFYGYKIYIKDSYNDEKVSASLWRFINYETEYNGEKYFFTLGGWYKVNSDYYTEIRNYCEAFEESGIAYVNCLKRESEGDYNKRLAASSSDYILLDRDLVRSDISRSEIEACDIFTNSKEFIHVKFRSSSATLSHLFAQGRVAAYSLMRDNTFRERLRNKVGTLGLDKKLIPTASKKLVPSHYTVTFAIIENKRRSFVEALPFFSLVNFRLTAGELSEFGFKVKVKKILIV